jgi:MFS family permease
VTDESATSILPTQLLRPGERRISLIAILASAFASTLTFAMSTPLLSMRLEAQGVSGSIIGLNTAVEAAAILFFTLATPTLARRLGAANALYLGGALITAAIALLPIWNSIEGWFVLRFVMGAGIAIHWVIGEVWLNTVADDATRGRVVGLYVTAMSAAYCLGFPVLMITGTEGYLPFYLITGTVAASVLPLIFARRLIPSLPSEPAAHYATLLRRQPTLMAAAVLNGVLINSVLAFFPIFSDRMGVGERAGFGMLFAVALGNVLLQLPIGMMADRHDGRDGRKLLILLAIGSATGFLLLPLVLGSLAAWPVLTIWGGSFGGLYTVGLAMVGRRFGPGDLAAANALFAFTYETGTLVGPVFVGTSLDLWNPYGFLAAGGAACLVFLLIALTRRV